MRKKLILCLALVLCVVLLTACGQQQQEIYPNQPRAPFTETPQTQTETGTDTGTAPDVSGSTVIDFDSGSYNPASEEDGQDELIPAAEAPTPAPTMYSEYAGATPVLIDPIDKPTPTPLPKLTFSYTTYEAAALHLTFQGPAGWTVDDTASDTYILTNPDISMDYAAQATIRVVPVNKNYTKNELIKELKGTLETLQSDGSFASFDPSNTATRAFIDGNGVYMSYKGTLKDGRGVAGRVIVNCVNKTLYILHCSYPRSMADTFAENVYNKIRSTMKVVK